MLDQIINKLNEVAQDLREPQVGANLEHQAAKLDKVREDLIAMRDLLTGGFAPNVHGGGTGRD